MKFTFPIALLSLRLTTCRAATVTLFYVQTESTRLPPPSETFKPLGVGSDGMTTYLEHIVASVYYEQQLNGGGTTFTSDGSVVMSPAPIQTFTMEPLTLEGTLVADATHLVFHKDPIPTGTRDTLGNKLSCDFDGRGGGACVNEYWRTGRPTATTTFTGSAVPIYTLVVGYGQSQGGGRVNAASPRVVFEPFVAWGVAMVGTLFGALHVL
ncbi:hypothetical protein LshimejAT787_2100330 [Lyophyllum shimeji]|uniref:Uncharacterized protein n=1 Tax=Lyophyllum shimeji TaxID=47721 RepID=A0A9P3Q191_LYOSH|nr:hypothetical protein LshimejAT787_2100330 [Lyophyllum shimeji]